MYFSLDQNLASAVRDVAYAFYSKSLKAIDKNYDTEESLDDFPEARAVNLRR